MQGDIKTSLGLNTWEMLCAPLQVGWCKAIPRSLQRAPQSSRLHLGRQRGTERVTKAPEEGRHCSLCFTWHLRLEEPVMKWNSAEQK